MTEINFRRIFLLILVTATIYFNASKMLFFALGMCVGVHLTNEILNKAKRNKLGIFKDE